MFKWVLEHGFGPAMALSNADGQAADHAI